MRLCTYITSLALVPHRQEGPRHTSCLDFVMLNGQYYFNQTKQGCLVLQVVTVLNF